MAARERSYIPEISNALLVPVEPTDGAVFRRKSPPFVLCYMTEYLGRVRTIKSLITELEDVRLLLPLLLPYSTRSNSDGA
jgi:hypothetical protein